MAFLLGFGQCACGGGVGEEYERVKAINSELRSRIVLAAGEVLSGSIFDGAIEGLGADISKLHKQIMEERDEFSFRDLSQRAAFLPVTDPRRMALYANSKGPFSKSLLSGLPVLNIFFTQTKSSTAVALHFGIPIPALRAHVGKPIQPGMRRGGPSSLMPTDTQPSYGASLAGWTYPAQPQRHLQHSLSTDSTRRDFHT
jgi:hypothetical protein